MDEDIDDIFNELNSNSAKVRGLLEQFSLMQLLMLYPISEKLLKQSGECGFDYECNHWGDVLDIIEVLLFERTGFDMEKLGE